jgi:signal transduction histidine kinase
MNAPPYDRILADLGILLLHRVSGRTYSLPGVPPVWFQSFVPEVPANDQPIEPGVIFPFLDHFLEDAEHFWAGGNEGEFRSGFWTETLPEGADIHFEAIACKADAADYLLVRRLTTGFEQLQNVFQKGRELSLIHERLVAETGKKEILLHCIIHDMSGPLQGMMGSLQIAEQETQSEESRRFVHLGLLAAQQQANLIDDLLDTFRSEVSTKDAISADPATAPDVISCAGEVLSMLQPAFTVRGVSGELIPPMNAMALHVVAEKGRLERVFYNLLQNAMRHSPRGGRVTISLREEDDFIRVLVEDEGAGIPADLVPQLFQKFVRRGQSRGKAGLGLFFCRITVEHWGGTIGCEPRPGGGTIFWFRLKRI